DLDRSLDDPALPPPVRAMRRDVAAHDALLISSPEYAHGIPGVLKNALDWLVSSTDFPGMPVAVLGASVLSAIAPVQLREILVTMNARFVSEASVTIPVPGAGGDAAGIAANPELSAMLREALGVFVRVIEGSE
ncbi:MAG TPA: NADPH-dependent FMN reductase, partial [Gemmatimonadaceae bacterium]|nr:NADPH-dependent FMN reductase [Gemmatimonadaceae bacterium]